MKFTTKIGLIPFFLALLLQGSSLRAVFKYLPAPTLVSLLLLGGGLAGYALLIARANQLSVAQFSPFRKPKVLCTLLIAVMAVASYVIYPMADARRDLGGGSTADDALIQASRSFLASGSMYAEKLAGDIPISPGPGWVLLNLPWANSHLYWAMSPLYVLASVAVYCWLFGSARQSAVVLCLVSSSLLFWELLVTGHDLVALSFSFAAMVMLTWRLSQNREQSSLTPVALGILAGTIATSRLVFAGFPLLLAILAWKSNRKVAVLVGGVGILIAASFHACFFLTSDHYQPLHLLGRGKHGVGLDLIALGLVAEVIAVGYALLRGGRRPDEWLYGAWLCLAVPLFLISFGELRAVGWSFARWEGANYLFPCIPCYLFYVATSVFEESRVEHA